LSRAFSGNGFDWNFTVQGDPSNGVFSFSGGSEAIPDGGATVALLGLALTGIEGIRRKLMRGKELN
jgi:VPDSG-CTERM motif